MSSEDFLSNTDTWIYYLYYNRVGRGHVSSEYSMVRIGHGRVKGIKVRYHWVDDDVRVFLGVKIYSFKILVPTICTLTRVRLVVILWVCPVHL
jgi:hypothetical protein